MPPHVWVSAVVQTGHICNGCVVRVHPDVTASLTLQVPSWKPAKEVGFVSFFYFAVAHLSIRNNVYFKLSGIVAQYSS